MINSLPTIASALLNFWSPGTTRKSSSETVSPLGKVGGSPKASVNSRSRSRKADVIDSIIAGPGGRCPAGTQSASRIIRSR